MSERDSYIPGEFCWVDLASPDPEASKSFYGDLMGWEVMESPDREKYGDYAMFTREGKVVAGIGPLMSEDQPPAWASYISVADLGDAQDKVREAGGEVLMGDIEIPGDVGAMAVCQDAEGAVFCLWRPGHNKGSQLVNEPGSWTWNSLGTRDFDAAADFYGKAFGWTFARSDELPPEVPYMQIHLDGEPWEEGIAGALAIGEGMPAETPPHWMVYLCVPSADEAVDKVEAAGGQLLMGPQAIGVGKVAVFTDPQGATFSIIEPDYPEPR